MITFTAKGHQNIRATHRNTLEFTKDTNLSTRGDCIVGLDADFSLDELKNALESDRLVIRLKIEGITDEFTAVPNPLFNDDRELVIRVGDYGSERTFALASNKAAQHLRRDLVEKMKKPEAVMTVEIEYETEEL